MGRVDDAATDVAGEAARVPGSLVVCVVYSPHAGAVDEVETMLPAGATLRQALDASGLRRRWPDVDFDRLPLGVWGTLRSADRVLRDQDRVEVYRPLAVDPKEARRARQRKQTERTGQLAKGRR